VQGPSPSQQQRSGVQWSQVQLGQRHTPVFRDCFSDWPLPKAIQLAKPSKDTAQMAVTNKRRFIFHLLFLFRFIEMVKNQNLSQHFTWETRKCREDASSEENRRTKEDATPGDYFSHRHRRAKDNVTPVSKEATTLPVLG